jgi:hypothetical protein
MEVRRTREGRRTMKLLMTPETENDGISGELRFLVRARGDLEVCAGPSLEGSTGGNSDELLFARERVERGLGDCTGAEIVGRGGEPQKMEENEERDECERKKFADVGSDDCGDEDEMLGSRGCETVQGPCGVVGNSEGVPHDVDGRPSALGRTTLVGVCASIETPTAAPKQSPVFPDSGPPNLRALFGVIGVFSSNFTRVGIKSGGKTGTGGTGGAGSTVV